MFTGGELRNNFLRKILGRIPANILGKCSSQIFEKKNGKPWGVLGKSSDESLEELLLKSLLISEKKSMEE